MPDASGWLVKAELSRVIRHIVKDKNWTQHRAADVLGIAPTDVSDLMRGKLARFSQRRLERFLNALGILWSGRRLKRNKPVAPARNSGRTVADLISENRE